MSDPDMERELVTTNDGSHSLYVPAMDEGYHSVHGALSESQHVFVEMGMNSVEKSEEPLRILEIGFGTGLNALLTLADMKRPVEYISLEAHPISVEEAAPLNYVSLLEKKGIDCKDWFQWLHAVSWGEWHEKGEPDFRLFKWEGKMEDFVLDAPVDVVYFDAFAPNKQPELWTLEVFQKMAGWMAPGALLPTYCAKGAVRRTMQAAGLETERLPGPPGKREMLRARKPKIQI